MNNSTTKTTTSPLTGRQITDLSGRRFGNLTVISLGRGERIFSKNGKVLGTQYYWVCQCDCGELTLTWSNNLIKGHTKSCGCKKYPEVVDISGQQFGKWKVLRLDRVVKKQGARWICKCDCGTVRSVSATGLRHGKSESCGCSNIGPNNSNWNPNRDAVRSRNKVSRELEKWRRTVYERDSYTCQSCGTVGTELNAHHLFSWNGNKKKRLLVENGLTLCVTCHRGFHSWNGWRNKCTPNDYVEWKEKRESSG